MNKTEEMRKIKHIKHDKPKNPNSDRDEFLEWKHELNKDLKSFWEYMTE